jgi:hypothetical protein
MVHRLDCKAAVDKQVVVAAAVDKQVVERNLVVVAAVDKQVVERNSVVVGAGTLVAEHKQVVERSREVAEAVHNTWEQGPPAHIHMGLVQVVQGPPALA